MPAFVDQSPFGARTPDALVAAVLSATTRLPANWLGLRLAIALRRIAMRRLGFGGADVIRWGMNLRLYPRGNGCEKNLLFTPQMFEPMERQALAEAIKASPGEFTFVDVGANVGLFSLFVAAQAGARACILAIEPQPGILDRLLFNIAANRDVRIETLAIAVADQEGEAELAINASDHGGTRLGVVLERFAASGPAAPTVRVRCRPLLAVLAERGLERIDALKIDVEGAEDLALSPFLCDAPDALLPRLVIIEDSRASWRVDLFGQLAARGYCVLARSKQNVVLGRSPEGAGAQARANAPGTGM